MIVLEQLRMVLVRSVWERRTYKTAVVLGLVSSVVGCLQFAILGSFLQQGNTFTGIGEYGGGILSFLLTGSIFTGFVSVSLGTFSRFVQNEQRSGTLEALVTSDVSLLRLMIYHGVIGLVGTVVSSIILLLGFGLVFHVDFSVDVSTAAIVLLLMVVTMGSLGLAGCGILLVTKRGDPITWTLTTVTVLMSGVLYPTSALPAWMSEASQWIPTTRALHALRLALGASGTIEQVLPDLAALTGWAVVALPMSVLVFRAGLRRARVSGSISEF